MSMPLQIYVLYVENINVNCRRRKKWYIARMEADVMQQDDVAFNSTFKVSKDTFSFILNKLQPHLLGGYTRWAITPTAKVNVLLSG